MSSPEIFPLPGYRVDISPDRVEPSEALPRDVPFQLQGVLPAPLVYLTRDDSLWVRAYNSVAGAEVEVRGRLLLPNGELFRFAQRVAPTSDRAANDSSLDFGLPRDIEGCFLVNLAVVRSSGSFRRGQFFVQVAVFRGSGAAGFRHQILASGYVCHDLVVTWPGTGINSPVEGPGALRSVLGTDPAAGAEISETVPDNARWRLHSVRAALVTDVTAPTRTVGVFVDDGTTSLFTVYSQTVQAASTTQAYNLAAYAYLPGPAAGQIFLPLPGGVYLSAGWRIRTLTYALAGGDNWGAPQMLVEEWIED